MTSTTIPWTTLLTSLVYQFPTIVVCVLGLTLAFTLLHKHPRAAPLVCIGLGLLLLASLTQPFVYPLIQHMAMQSFRPGAAGFAIATSGFAFAFNVLRAIAIAILAYAAFVDRPGHFHTAAKP